jgi:glutamate formiminotransferase/formiminotetrahydrofolate cyclodeaminase
MQKLIECVPNFSEGRNSATLERIADAVRGTEGVWLLDVDPGKATHRTVFTFVGAPEAVIEAALAAAKVGAECIDMTQHKGEHPRFGAMDVCPLIPISNVTLAECAGYAQELGRRLGEEQGRSVYLYESAALTPERKNLAKVRAGEYEGLAERMSGGEHVPDHGPATFDPRYGATAVGARPFLIAYNVNLNTTSARRANAIAFDVREKGRMLREPDPLIGEIARDKSGDPIWIPGALQCVKGIGWFIEEYGVAQVSMNLTDLETTPLHKAFDTCCEKATERGIRVTGSEAVGLVPLQAMLDAGRHYLRLQKRSTGVSDRELVRLAVKSMGLDELSPFDPDEKVIEYAIEAKTAVPRLVNKTLRGFIEETASESPAPGGGSIAATVGALGAALGTMVANLSSHKRGWDDRWETFSKVAERGKRCHAELTLLVDKDTDAFNAIMAAWKLKGDEREVAIQAATRLAIEAPLAVMHAGVEAIEICANMAENGMRASLSDAAVGALCGRLAVRGAALNVRINAGDYKDKVQRDLWLQATSDLEETARVMEEKIIAAVNEALG